MSYVKLASEKYQKMKSRSTQEPEDLREFLGFCFTEYRPNEYGKRIQKRFETYFGFTKISQSEDKGDSLFRTTNNTKLLLELKVSFLGVNNYYTVRYIRPWQEFDYYLICFIDPNNCDPKFIVVTCEDLINNFKCGYMNGTKESNLNNSKSALGTSFLNKGQSYEKLLRLNRLKGNDPIHVFEFLASQNKFD